MYVKRNNGARSCKHCCSGKAMTFAYSACVCVCVALGIQHAMRLLHIVISRLPSCTKLFLKSYWTWNVPFDFPLQILSETFLILRRNERDTIQNVHWSSSKVPLFFSDFNETEILSTDFRKYSSIKFHDNPSNGSLVVPCGRTGRNDKANRHVRKIGNLPKIHYLSRKLSSQSTLSLI